MSRIAKHNHDFRNLHDEEQDYPLRAPSPPNHGPASPVGPTPWYIKDIPSDILAQVFSFLDPSGFADVILVSKHWHQVALDEYTWRAAFERMFGVHAVVARLAETWRDEYCCRNSLIK
jgi:F-box-like